MNIKRSEFFNGIKAVAPLCVGIVPFGMIYGVMGLEIGLTVPQTQAMSSLVFAGSSQIVLCQLLAHQAPLLVIFLTVSIINLRHLLYSASVAPTLRDLPMHWKMILAYFLTDEAYATSIGHLNQQQQVPQRHWFLLGSGVMLWSTWQLSTLVGVLLGKGLPTSWGLDFAIPLTFIALVVPAVKTRADWVAVITSGIAAVLFYGLPFKMSLMVATLLGVLAGVGLIRKRELGR